MNEYDIFMHEHVPCMAVAYKVYHHHLQRALTDPLPERRLCHQVTG
jgi:hypothetical protein